MLDSVIITLIIILVIFIIFFTGIYTLKACNPFYENKHDVQMMMYNWYPDYVIESFLLTYENIGEVDLDQPILNNNYPFIFKLNDISSKSMAVQKIDNAEEALLYIGKYIDNHDIIIQPFYEMKYEIGLGMALSSGEPEIEFIFERIKDNPIAIQEDECVDREEWITEQNTTIFKKIFETIPYMGYTRFDILFDNLDDFLKGEKFKIIECDGLCGLNSASPNKKIDWLMKTVPIGLSNIIQLKGPNIAEFIDHIPFSINNTIKHGDVSFLLKEATYKK